MCSFPGRHTETAIRDRKPGAGAPGAPPGPGGVQPGQEGGRLCSQPHKPAKGHIYFPHAGTRSEHASTRLQVPAPDLLRSRVGLGGGGLGGSASTRPTTNQLPNHLASSANHQSAARVEESVSIQKPKTPQTGLGGDMSQASSPGAGGHEHKLSHHSEDDITDAPPTCRLQLAAAPPSAFVSRTFPVSKGRPTRLRSSDVQH